MSIHVAIRDPIRKIARAVLYKWKANKDNVFSGGSPDDISLTSLLALMGHCEGEWFAGGSGIIIGERIALTAKHVIDNLRRKWPKEFDQGKVDLVAFQMARPKQVVSWHVIEASGFFTDIVSLELVPFSEDARTVEWFCPTVSLEPPSVGDKVCGVGYSCNEISVINDNEIDVGIRADYSVGTVTNVFPSYRDRAILKFPCFETDTRFDDSMSGGPVFTEGGELCGIITSSIPPNNLSDAHTSYCCSLWPLMGFRSKIPLDDGSSTNETLLRDLAIKGYISAPLWRKVGFQADENRQIRRITFGAKPGEMHPDICMPHSDLPDVPVPTKRINPGS